MPQKKHADRKESEIFGHPTLSRWVFIVGLTCGLLAIGFAFAMMIKGIIAGGW